MYLVKKLRVYEKMNPRAVEFARQGDIAL